MSTFEFVSHDSFPDDPYIKELVYLCLDGKYRVAFVRKATKNGGFFWGGISASIVKDGVKEYFDAFMQDSAFLTRDIKDFLDKRKWETQSVKINKVDDNIPF
jgi:hypothetical protein